MKSDFSPDFFHSVSPLAIYMPNCSILLPAISPIIASNCDISYWFPFHFLQLPNRLIDPFSYSLAWHYIYDCVYLWVILSNLSLLISFVFHFLTYSSAIHVFPLLCCYCSIFFLWTKLRCTFPCFSEPITRKKKRLIINQGILILPEYFQRFFTDY